MHQELTTLRSQIDTRSRLRLVETKSLMPDPIREEDRPELENLVVLGKGLRRRSARSVETGDEDCREQEDADCRDKPPT